MLFLRLCQRWHPFSSSVTCIFHSVEHSKGSTFIRLSKRIERIFAFFCLLFYTLYIYTRARALPGCVRLDHAPPHHTTHHAHQGSSFWSILDAFCFSSLSSRESGICDEKVEGLRILDSQRLPFGASWKLLVSLFSPRENREFMDERAGSSEFSILRDCVLKSALDASSFSLRESRIRG